MSSELADGLFTGKSGKGVVAVEKEPYDVEVDETVRVEYDRSLLFPLTRWLQMNRGSKVSHQMLDEFNHLVSEAQAKFASETDFENPVHVWGEIVDPVHDAVFHLWDVQGELRPWIVEKSCRALLGARSGGDLPKASLNAFHREAEYRDGLNSAEMALANIEDAVMGVDQEDKGFSDEEIEEAAENDQGIIEYEHNLDQYFK